VIAFGDAMNIKTKSLRLGSLIVAAVLGLESCSTEQQRKSHPRKSYETFLCSR